MRRFIFYFLLFFLLTCGIENPEAAIEFGAPLGLVSYRSNDSIYLTFYGFNNETYFEGYNVYISVNNADLINFSILGERILSNQNAVNKPTIEVNPFSDGPRKFVFEITSNYYVTTNNSEAISKYLIGRTTYFFTVRATGNGIVSRKFSNVESNTY